MSASQSKARGKNWLLALAMLGTALAYVVFVYLPGQRDIDEIKAQIQSKTRSPAEEANLAAQLGQMQKELQETRAFVQQWRDQSPDDPELPRLFGQISRFAKSAGIAVSRFEPQPTEELAGIRKFLLNVECNGTFAQIYGFVEEMENLKQSVWIDELQVQRVSESGQNLGCTLKVVIFADKLDKSD